jgi:UDP-MurNAc hydroxylase
VKLQYLASATVLVEHAGVRVLCDPWLTSGIYGGAWYHNPPLAVQPEDIRNIDAIYLSHIHPDHADLATLNRLPRCPVLIGSYADDFLGKRLRGLGFHVQVLHPQVALVLGGQLSVKIVPADDCDPERCGKWIGCPIADPRPNRSYQIDTLAVFRAGDEVIVNTNDCPFPLAEHAIRRLQSESSWVPPGLLLVGYGGAGPWPQCFPEQATLENAELKKSRGLAQMRQFVELVNPKAYLPFAGQYTLGGSLAHLNPLRGVPELEELPDDDRMVRLNRNGWYDCATGDHEPFVPVDPRVRAAGIESLKMKRLDHEADDWPEASELHGLMNQAVRAWRERCEQRGFSTDWTLLIWARDDYGTFMVEGGDKVLTINVDARLLKRLLTKRFHWNNAEVGSLLTMSRNPDVYEPGLFNALCYFHV